MQASSAAVIEQESKGIQVAYTMGGMTIALHHGNYDDAGYTANKSWTKRYSQLQWRSNYSLE